MLLKITYNQALVRTFTTLRFIHAAQLGRYAVGELHEYERFQKPHLR